MQARIALFCMATSMALMACGGGGDGGAAAGGSATGTSAPTASTTDVVNKYEGVWSSCVFRNNTFSTSYTYTFKKTGSNTADSTFVGTDFSTANCSGASTQTSTSKSRTTFTGTQFIGTTQVDTADDYVFYDDDASATVPRDVKSVMYVSGNKLYLKDTDAAQGYPTTISTRAYTKQQP